MESEKKMFLVRIRTEESGDGKHFKLMDVRGPRFVAFLPSWSQDHLQATEEAVPV